MLTNIQDQEMFSVGNDWGKIEGLLLFGPEEALKLGDIPIFSDLVDFEKGWISGFFHLPEADDVIKCLQRTEFYDDLEAAIYHFHEKEWTKGLEDIKVLLGELIPGLADCSDLPYAEDMIDKAHIAFDLIINPIALTQNIAKNMVFHGGKIISYSMDAY